MLASLNRFSNQATDLTTLDDGHDVQGAGRIDASITAAAGLQVDAGAQAEWTDEARLRQRFTRWDATASSMISADGPPAREAIAQLRWTAGPLTLVPGARADHWSLTGETTASPWLQGDWKLAPSIVDPRRCRACIVSSRTSSRSSARSDSPTRERSARRSTILDSSSAWVASMRWQVTLYDREEERLLPSSGAPRRGWCSAASSAVRRRRRIEPSLDGYARGVELLVQRQEHAAASRDGSPIRLAATVSDDQQTHETLLGRSRPAPHAESLRVLPDLGPHEREREAARRQQRAGARLLRAAGR